MQNATTTVFGLQQLGVLGLRSEAFGCPFFSRNTQAITGHHRHIHSIDLQQLPDLPINGLMKTICFYRSPVRAIITPLTQRIVIALNFFEDDDVWSSVDG